MTIYSTPRRVPARSKRKEEVSVSKARTLSRGEEEKFHTLTASRHEVSAYHTGERRINWKFN